MDARIGAEAITTREAPHAAIGQQGMELDFKPFCNLSSAPR
jgi:hypothetical protein